MGIREATITHLQAANGEGQLGGDNERGIGWRPGDHFDVGREELNGGQAPPQQITQRRDYPHSRQSGAIAVGATHRQTGEGQPAVLPDQPAGRHLGLKPLGRQTLQTWTHHTIEEPVGKQPYRPQHQPRKDEQKNNQR